MKNLLLKIFAKDKVKVNVSDGSGKKTYSGRNIQLVIDGEFITNLNGDINITVEGNVEHVDTVSGNVNVKCLAGDIDSVSGPITIENIIGNNTKIDTVSGSIRVKSANSIGKIDTVSGSVNIGKAS